MAESNQGRKKEMEMGITRSIESDMAWHGMAGVRNCQY